MTEIGSVMEPSAGYSARLAARTEEMGFDSAVFPDTQNLCSEVYVQLALVAAATKTMRIGPGVTNPVTRDPAVSASALATLQLESGGRIICGLGRGDSSAAHIGKRQGTTEEVREYANLIRGYISGEKVDRDGTPSGMRWIEPGAVPQVPIDIACTGPKTIRMAADCADRISFAVGSAPERIDWALGVLEARLAETGRDRSELSVGAYINLVCDEDEEKAVKMSRTVTGLIAHFTGMEHAPLDVLPDRLRDLAIKLRTGYDMAHHAQGAGSHLEYVDDAFVRWFSICGNPEYCTARLSALVEKGLEHVYILGGSPVEHPHGARIEARVTQDELFASQVLPHFR
jgi:5,10-methylenetetrahydromethanopterin reductase